MNPHRDSMFLPSSHVKAKTPKTDPRYIRLCRRRLSDRPSEPRPRPWRGRYFGIRTSQRPNRSRVCYLYLCLSSSAKKSRPNHASSTVVQNQIPSPLPLLGDAIEGSVTYFIDVVFLSANRRSHELPRHSGSPREPPPIRCKRSRLTRSSRKKREIRCISLRGNV